MIIYQRFLSLSAETHVRSLYHCIIDEFIAISAHLHKQRTSMRMPWFHIHISKAGGTTLKNTFTRIGKTHHENQYLLSTSFKSCATQY